ncbi:DUF4197 domain-containing protein [Desulforegula conservatrix]|uniref:DUF4197 domain-containing protein n=1 Tax=Desulforegula conservatrix TaxID=153026 RepID=UPI00048640E4|nr:DUF4197 domain-containing protein [Desulforegula conservatrix]
MKKIIFLIISLSCLMLVSCVEVLKQIPAKQISSAASAASGGLTSDEIIMGLKEALIVGAMNSTELTSKTDGFNLNPLIRIPFPPEAAKVKTTVEQLGFANLTKDFEQSLNRAAEEGSKKALPIFKNAIVNMSISDGMSILRGPNNAATEYLKSKTQSALVTEFTPVVKNAIQTVDVTKYWDPIASVYNKTTLLTGQSQVNPNLDQYITQKSLDGLFYLIAQEEMKIRENPAARASDILKKVFGSN